GRACIHVSIFPCLILAGASKRASMSYAEFQRHPRMSLRPEQHSHIAAAYDKAAFDTSLPAHTRAAFARKADWFCLLARVGKKKSKRYSRNKNPRNHSPTRFGSGACKAMRVGKALFTGRASSARAKP